MFQYLFLLLCLSNVYARMVVLPPNFKPDEGPPGPSRKEFKDSFGDYEFEDKVTHPEFPDYELQVRTVSNSTGSLGVDTVKQYSGYLTVNGESHMFFWFFESRSKPSTDPTLLWLNGGPGCSSMEGLLFENGPSFVQPDLSMKRNEYSWNTNANVIYLDQPVNTGYSYSPNKVNTTTAASKDVYAFLSLFFHTFPKYNEGEFHISGESYAGHYIPVFASDILSAENRRFNMTSILIGNGLTNPLIQYQYYQPMACGGGGISAKLPSLSCNLMKATIPLCVDAIQQCYDNPSNASACYWASELCNAFQEGFFDQTGLNVYDMREKCATNTTLCYPASDFIAKYMNQPHVKKAIGANPSLKYQGCNDKTNLNFQAAGDNMQPYHLRVAKLLNNSIPVLIYAGDKDFICNWLGNRAWTKALEYQDHDKFSQAKAKSWVVENTPAGEVTNYNHFTFLRVYQAGHMVPHDQPKNSWYMVNSWLNKDFAFSNSSKPAV